MRGRKEGNVKLSLEAGQRLHGDRHGELTNRSAINSLILPGNRSELENRHNCIVIMAHTALSSHIVHVNSRRLINAK